MDAGMGLWTAVATRYNQYDLSGWGSVYVSYSSTSIASIATRELAGVLRSPRGTR
jgi:hypothetical protein